MNTSIISPSIRPDGWRKIRAATGLALAGLLFVGPTQAGLLEDDEARKAILELRQRVETMRQSTEAHFIELARKSAEENAQLRRSLVDLQNQIEAQRAAIAAMRGQAEQLQREISETQRRSSEVTLGLDDRLRRIEPSSVRVDGQEFLAEVGERKDFEAAMALFKTGDFTGTQPLLIEFIRRYPTSGYRSSALFWLGNAQYATRDFKEAITNFRAMLAQVPEHVRAPETLLSIANCQLELKDPRAARKTLEDLVKAYPQAEASAAAKERLLRLK